MPTSSLRSALALHAPLLLAPGALAQGAGEGTGEASPSASDAPEVDPWSALDAPAPPDPERDGPWLDWGVAAGVRWATSPYTEGGSSDTSFVPRLYFEGRRFFLRGTEGGVHLWSDASTEVNLLGRLTFHEVPEAYRDVVGVDSFDLGLQWVQGFAGGWTQVEALSDDHGRWYAAARLGTSVVADGWVLLPSLALRYDSAHFVDHYFGLEEASGPPPGGSSGGGWEFVPRVDARLHLVSDLYLIGSLSYRALSESIRDLSTVDRSGLIESYLGLGFFQDVGRTSYQGLPKEVPVELEHDGPAPYVRLAHGLATPSALEDIVLGSVRKDEFTNRLTSVFYGHPLTDTLFGLPVEVYATTGLVFHHASDVQDPTWEGVVAVKGYVPIHWPTLWRVGLAEGLSWIGEPTFIEASDLEGTGKSPSHLMNYLDLSLDLNVGDLFGSRTLERLWLGWSVHHRSAIFETASQFGRLKSGSNYNTVYLQWDLW